MVSTAISEYKNAVYCIEAMKRKGIYGGEKIGVVARNLCFPDDGLCFVEAGQVILYWNKKDGSEVLIAEPLPKEDVTRFLRSRISGLELKTTIFHVNKRWVKDIPYK